MQIKCRSNNNWKIQNKNRLMNNKNFYKIKTKLI